MPLSIEAANRFLNACRGTAFSYAGMKVSLHSGDPGSTGANEVTGGGYARQTATFTAAAGGQMSNDVTLTFTNLPAIADLRYVCLWSDLGELICSRGVVTPPRVVAAGGGVSCTAGSLIFGVNG